MVQYRVRPAILFGFFWVAIRRRKVADRLLGKNGAEKSQIREPGNQGVVVEVT